MTIPYTRITTRVELESLPCALCTAVTLMPVLDHCPVHGMTRGVLCVTCHGGMARVDADLSRATPRDMFHRDNCPGCRAAGFAGVSRLLERHAPRPRDTDAEDATDAPLGRGATRLMRLARVRELAAPRGTVTLAVIMADLGVPKTTASELRKAALAPAASGPRLSAGPGLAPP